MRNNPDLSPSYSLFHIFGMVFTDGYYCEVGDHKYLIGCHAKDEKLLESFKSSLEKINLSSYYEKEDRIEVGSVDLFNLLDEIEYSDLEEIAENKDHKRGFIRGFYEGDGSITNTDKSYQLSIYTTSVDKINLVKSFLEDLGYHPTLIEKERKPPRKKQFVLGLYRNSEINEFFDEMKPRLKLP